MVPSYRKNLGLIQVPLLVDPNNNVEMLETNDIMEYLNKNYKIGEVLNESFSDYTTQGAGEGHYTADS